MFERDPVQNYRPGPASEAPLLDGERVQAIFTPDRARYLRDHVNMAGLGVIAATVVLFALGRLHTIWAAVLGVIAAVAFRGIFLRSEVFARRWQLTDRRLIGPQGRVVNLLEIKALRRLWGDVQVVTADGAKHLMKHLADPQAVIDTIEAARAARAANRSPR
ncbi:hypothetical protein ACEYYA_08030 [Paracoccus sp. p3-h83]|uniref:hypothetical protein n=1 Tax=Paracoccus sp. p3-h83 TaxID=3342805 RepID=UPI0035B8CAD7